MNRRSLKSLPWLSGICSQLSRTRESVNQANRTHQGELIGNLPRVGRRPPPALVTRMSRPSSAAIASATTRLTSAALDTSAADQPTARISAAARLICSASREHTNTRAPSSARDFAQALPRPLLAPATKALQSFKPRSIPESQFCFFSARSPDCATAHSIRKDAARENKH